ncbi:hypothetical protein [Nesterenkonia sp. CF4.4]|uniref:hypothetical protein n=1 Tax=Nesterenkonia sp. CF4.4 TaxID=3373079 RepID=UPI003EE44AE3
MIGCTTGLQDPNAPAGVPNYVVEDASGPDMGLQGRIAEIRGCYYIQGPAPEHALTLALFPAHELEEAPDGAEFTWRGVEYSAGDDITVGGGGPGPDIYDVPEECDDDAERWLVTPSTPRP